MKKLLVIGFITVMSIGLVGCGKKTEVAETKEVTTELSTVDNESTTEELTTEEKVEKEDKTTEQTTEKAQDKKTTEKKTDNNITEKKTDNKKAIEQKTTVNNTTGNNTTNTTSTSGNTNATQTTTTTDKKQQTTECQHNWVEQTKTVHHDAVYDWVITKPADVYYWRGDCCGGVWYHNYNDDPHASLGQTTGSSGQWIKTPAEGGYMEVQAAYDEVVGTGTYKCSKCGATK